MRYDSAMGSASSARRRSVPRWGVVLRYRLNTSCVRSGMRAAQGGVLF